MKREELLKQLQTELESIKRKDAFIQTVYNIACTIAHELERRKLTEEYDCTYNSMEAIAEYGRPLR